MIAMLSDAGKIDVQHITVKSTQMTSPCCEVIINTTNNGAAL
jgi:hypothetical protein